jgi:KDO2-lipid IV(A) lauroyltransferase
VDRNVRRRHGGIWVPFLGLEARTTPLPAWLHEKTALPIVPMFCLPIEGGRYRVWIGEDLARGVAREDPEAAARAIAERMNDLIGDFVRRRPEIWNWTLKRYKSRPREEQGRYPVYSEWDPDPA